MFFPLHIDAISMELSILNSNGSQVEISKLCIPFSEYSFDLSKKYLLKYWFNIR